MDLDSEYHWSVPLFDAQLVSEDLRVTAKSIFFDSGSSVNYIPFKEFDWLLHFLKKRTKCVKDVAKDFHICDCESTEDERFPPIQI